jgi:hypothetical protein
MSDGILFTAPKMTKVIIPVDQCSTNVQKRNLLKILNKIPEKLSETGKDKLLLRLAQQTDQSSVKHAKAVDLSTIKSALEGFTFNETILPEMSTNEKFNIRGKDLRLHFALKDNDSIDGLAAKVKQKVSRAVSLSKEQQRLRLTRIRKLNSFTQRMNEDNRNRIWGNSLVEQSFVQNNQALNWLKDPTLDGSRSKSRDSIRVRITQESVTGRRELSDRVVQRVGTLADPTSMDHSSIKNEAASDQSSRLNSTLREFQQKKAPNGRTQGPVLITDSDRVDNSVPRAYGDSDVGYQLRLTKFIQRVDLAKKKAAKAIDIALANIGTEPDWLEQANNE